MLKSGLTLCRRGAAHNAYATFGPPARQAYDTAIANARHATAAREGMVMATVRSARPPCTLGSIVFPVAKLALALRFEAHRAEAAAQRIIIAAITAPSSEAL